MAESDLEKNAEFTQIFKNHEGDEDPVLVAQRFLNIFRQLHIFTAAKRKEFDNDLLKLPTTIRGSFASLPGGALLQDYVHDLEKKAGMPLSGGSAALRKAIADDDYKESSTTKSHSSDEALEDIKKLIAADMAARASMPAQTVASGGTTTIAGPISGEVKLVADESLKSDLLTSIEKIMEENRKAQSQNTQTLAQFLSESQQKLAEALAQKTESGAWAESLAQVLSENKDGININSAAPAIDSGKLIDEIIEKQSSMFLEMSERQSDKLGTVLSSALQQTNQASTKMIMDALEAFQKENTRLINMQEKIQRAILETEKRNSAPYSGFTLTTGNVSVNRDPSLDNGSFGGFGFNTGLGAFGSMGGNTAGSTNNSAPKVEEPKVEDKKDEAAANFERLESLLSDADNLFKLNDEPASKKKKKKKKKKNKNKEVEAADNTDNENDIVILYDDDETGDKASNNDEDKTSTAAAQNNIPEVETQTEETQSPIELQPEHQEEWEYVTEPEENAQAQDMPTYDEQEYADYEYDDSTAHTEADEYTATTSDEWEYVSEDEAQAGDGEQEWEYVSEDEAQAGDGEQEWDYVSEDEAQAGDGEQEWEYVSEDEAQAGDGEQEWEYVSEDEAQAGDGEQEWEYVSEDENNHLENEEATLSQPQNIPQLSEIDPTEESSSNVFNPIEASANPSLEESNEASMPTDVFNPLYGEQIQFDPMGDNKESSDFGGLKLHEVSEFDNGSDDPYAPTTH